ncbi:MarR family winged helix-turn-helix transcriptional regulator [Arcobacter roscoffensis]|uniref:Winged helix-turn-helix transcriptional regulator n=1 Tax=Arcobacter roscoffensis TaxID=2961520 RepID=A0ABY5E5S5_9BACT|nr:MarR family transcriptional regulator [Arcobacter roscoffensis]UTJ06535.1 winged helix-turn-helix transcriptional regulator [Arcobacter roscoffensis]
MSICFLSLETSKVFNELILKELEEVGFSGLSSSLITIFPYIKEYENISISNLAKKLGYSRQAMHKNLKKLEDLGYLSFSQELNKKEKTVILTKKSESLISKANEFIQKIQDELCSTLGKEELDKYIKTQNVIYEFLETKNKA